MKRRDQLAVAALGLMLAAVGTAMFVPDSASGPQPTPIYVTPPPGLTFREGIVGHPNSINPLTPRTQADRDLVALLFRGLVRNGPNGTLLPDLASSWTASSDGLTYTFNLRTDAVWSDGKPVTATDVAFTVGLAQDPDYDGPLGASWLGIKATAVSDSIVRFNLTAPLGGFLRQTLLPILPEHLLSGTAVGDLADSDYSGHPVGDGPYRIAELDDSHALLTRVGPADVPTDAATGSGAAAASVPTAIGSVPTATAPVPAAATPAPQGNVETIDLVFFDDQASAIAGFRAGTLDAVGGLTPDALDATATRAGSRVTPFHMASLYSVVVNQRSTHPEFAKPGARQGLLAAIDRAGIVKTVLQGRGSAANVPLPGWSAAYIDKAVSVTAYSVTDAAADLTAAGWTRDASGWTAPGGKGHYALKLLSPAEATNPVAFRIAGQVAAAWRGLGLDVTIQTYGAADYAQHLTNADFDAAVVNYQIGLDPDVSPLLLSTQVAPAGSNLSGVADTSLDQLLSAVRTTTDAAARQVAISALETYVSTNVLTLPICFADYEFVVAHRVQGLETNEIADPSGRYWDVLDWRLASDG